MEDSEKHSGSLNGRELPPLSGCACFLTTSIVMLTAQRLGSFCIDLSQKKGNRICRGLRGTSMTDIEATLMSDVAQCGDADADRGRYDGTQGCETGSGGASGGKDIINQQKMSDSAFFHQDC